jgi:hypothetical protein
LFHAVRRGSAAAHHPAGPLTPGHLDEYQDGVCHGSLVRARRCWLDLLAADALPLPHRFTFVFGCPTERMAQGLTDFLRYTPYAGVVRTAGEPGTAAWQVVGTTHPTIWSLPSLEHLFMHLRGAGARYESPIEALDLVAVEPCLP